MLPESMKEMTTPASLAAWDASVILEAEAPSGETVLLVDPDRIAAVCAFLKDHQRFERLVGVTAVDRYPAEPRFEVVYLLHSIARNERLRLKCRLPGKAAEIDSIFGVWPGANWYEREVFDLFGIRFRNHPDLRRIMMPDDWEGHPLRRDFPVHGYKYSYQDK